MSQTVGIRPGAQLNGSGSSVNRARSQRRSRLGVALAGLVVLALAVLVFELLVPTMPQSHKVLVATRAVRSGEVIAPADVRVVSLTSNQVPGVAASRRDEVVGRTARLDIGSGQPLVEDDLGAAGGPGPGESVVGVSLGSGRFPPGLVAGDTVVIVDTPGNGSNNGPAPDATATRTTPGGELARGRVLSLGRTTDGTKMEVALVVPTPTSDAVALASATDSVSVVWVPR